MAHPKVIIGLNAFHGDASAAALVDGQFQVGVEEERFTRIKHWAGFPARALAHCMTETGSDGMGDIAALAVSRQPKAYLLRKIQLALTHPRSLGRAIRRVQNIAQVSSLRERVAS